MTSWLDNFAYRVDLVWWVFLVATVVSMLVALCTVGFQALRAAMANPVNSLRSE
jgi:putative ABC transport system permease protein